jgi:hypothetical protein
MSRTMMTTHKRKMIIILSTIVIVGGIGIASFLHLETLRSQQFSNNNRPTLKYHNNSLKVELCRYFHQLDDNIFGQPYSKYRRCSKNYY